MVRLLWLVPGGFAKSSSKSLVPLKGHNTGPFLPGYVPSSRSGSGRMMSDFPSGNRKKKNYFL